MSGLALFTNNMGIKVTGSDANNDAIIDKLIRNNIEVYVGHREENIDTEKETEKKTATRRGRTSKKAAENVEQEVAEKPVTRRGRTRKSASPTISLQFAGKSYSMEELHKMADEVWRVELEKGKEPYQSLELYVKPELRSKGIGKKLFLYMEEVMKREKVELILLSTATKNYKAILHFYLDELGMEFWNARLFKRI